MPANLRANASSVCALSHRALPGDHVRRCQRCRPRSRFKLVFFLVFGVLTILVTYMKNPGFLD